MRSLRMGIAALLAMAGIGIAALPAVADGIRKGGPPPAYYERPAIWQGLYGGAHLGSMDADGDDGIVGGVQVGYNWQANQIVYGLEADISAAGGDFIDLLASARGRLGYLIVPSLLVYGTAGLGVVSGDDSEAGFVYGLGVEGMITDTLSARVEYLAYDSDSGHGDGADVIRAGINVKLGR
jgi:outer membrane immunogenic protein